MDFVKAVTPCTRLGALALVTILCAAPWAVGQEGAEPAGAEDEDEVPSSRTLPFPILISDPTNGTGLGGGVLMLYRLGRHDPESQDSQTSVFGYYTTSKSWQLGVDQILSFKQDRFRSIVRGRFGNVNNRYEYPELPSDVVYGQRSDTVTAGFLVRAVGALYLGLNYRLADTRFAYDQGSDEEQRFSEVLLGELGARATTESGLGLLVAYDTRDEHYSPSRGVFAEAQFLEHTSWLGSDQAFRTLDLWLNTYHQVRPDHVIAARFRWRLAGGDVPFTAQSTFGGKDLRGYQLGKYRGDGTIAAQVEYRFPIKGRLGGVAFGGLGRVYGNDPTLGANTVLPNAGAGIRFLLLKDRGANVGVDFAWGRDGNRGVHFQFGEAF